MEKEKIMPCRTAAGKGPGKKLQKRGIPLVKWQKICYTIFHDAPSPSGKAGDFDSPIVGSTPAGATRKKAVAQMLCSGLFGYSLPFGSLK
jgi:hypothetical protein